MGDAARPFLLSVLTAAIVGQGVIARKKEILVLISIFDFRELWPCRFGRGPTTLFDGAWPRIPSFPEGQARLFLNDALIPCSATSAPLQLR